MCPISSYNECNLSSIALASTANFWKLLSILSNSLILRLTVTPSNQSAVSLNVNSLAASTIPPKVFATSVKSDALFICSWNVLYVDMISKKCFLTSLLKGLLSPFKLSLRLNFPFTIFTSFKLVLRMSLYPFETLVAFLSA